MKNLKLLLLCTCFASTPFLSQAQTWDGSSTSTTTSTGTPQVGIGTATPNADLEIDHTSTYNPSLPPGTGFGTIMKIESVRDFGTMTPSSIPGTDYNILEINHTDLFSSSGSPYTFFSVNTNGDVHVKRDMQVDAILDANALRANTFYIANGDLLMGHPTDGFRAIKAQSTNSGLGLYSKNDMSDGSSIRLNSEVPGGSIEFNSIGHSEMAGPAFMFSNVDPYALTMTPIALMEKNGDVTIPKLGTGTTQMVVADLSGKLGVQSLPSAQVLSLSGRDISLSGGGGTVTVPIQTISMSGKNLTLSDGGGTVLVKDDLGDHTATKDLNMSTHNIAACNKIRVDDVDLGTCRIKTTFQGASITSSGGAALFVNGTPSTTSSKLWVDGDIESTTKVIANSVTLTSDRRFKENIKEISKSDIIEKLKKITPYQYNFIQSNKDIDRRFDTKKHYGFLAQEVAEIFPELVDKINNNGYLGLNYIEFIPMLLQSLKDEDAQVQQQQKTIDELKIQATNSSVDKQALETQKAKIIELENKLAILEANMEVCCQNKNNSNNTHTSDNGLTGNFVKSTLDQNVPNPFGTETKIGFHIVSKYQAAFIGIYNLNGEQISKIPVQQGSNFVMVSAGQLKPGMYVYSLVVDNDLIDSKKMVVSE